MKRILNMNEEVINTRMNKKLSTQNTDYLQSTL